MFVCCECCVLSGRGLCNELITRPEESYRLWCVVVCDVETSRMRRPLPALGRSATAKKKNNYTTTCFGQTVGHLNLFTNLHTGSVTWGKASPVTNSECFVTKLNCYSKPK